ncbi:MAG: hypothetical protein L0Y44_02650 [Phycisphaerales bacterium]|nr:hypothetical protein [Phycisphaerales bacterium]
MAASPHAQLLATYVAHHNLGVKTGNFMPLLTFFAELAEMHFDGIEYGPLIGRRAIAQAFDKHPPSDELVISEPVNHADCASAAYAWSRKPSTPVGTIKLEAGDGCIVRIDIAVTGDRRGGRSG